MIFYELKVSYTRQTGEDNPAAVKETYLVEGLSCADVEERLLENIKPFVSGECEVKSCKQAQFFDMFPKETAEHWYKARVEMITVEESGKETRKAVSIFVQADSVIDAVKILQQSLVNVDCEIVSIAKSPILEVFRAVD